MKKIVVIGGVAGGMSFAARMRRLDETAGIIVIEKVASFPMRIVACLITSVV